MSFSAGDFNTRSVGFITPMSYFSVGVAWGATWITQVASATWPTANKALYVPFEVGEAVTVVKGFWLNGATPNNSIDIGIFAEDGTNIVSMGPTAQGTINIVQEVDITDTLIQPGRYFMGIVNGGTGTFFSAAPTAPFMQSWGCYTQASLSSATLPSPTATFAIDAAWAYIPVFGFSTKTRVV